MLWLALWRNLYPFGSLQSRFSLNPDGYGFLGDLSPGRETSSNLANELSSATSGPDTPRVDGVLPLYSVSKNHCFC